MQITNMNQLRKVMMDKIKKTMVAVNEKALADMYEETGKFYSGGEPISPEYGGYIRTGALGDTPRTTEVKVNDNEASFKAYLDINHKYLTGDKPTMDKVLELANYGKPWKTASGKMARQTVGSKGFWERAKVNIETDLEKIMKQSFNI